MNDMPEVSVVMANYNGRRYLEAAIKSLQVQTLGSWELILVDDASTDDSVALAEQMAQSDARIRVMRQPVNSGPAAARNRALAEARGRWIAIFDSDDIMLPARLETLRNRARSDNASIVADNQIVFSDELHTAKPLFTRDMSTTPHWISLAEFIDSNRLYSRLPDLGYLKPFIDRAMLRDSGVFYDEQLRIGEDYEFMARLLARGPKLRLEPAALYLYRKHAQSISYRIRGEDILALIEADDRLARGRRVLDANELAALARRRQSLDAMLSYDRVVTLVKAKQYGKAAALGLGKPRIWPLLTRPIRARWNRLRAAKAPPIAGPQTVLVER
jgi:succinoglycan biosynthesis protein ExoO